MRAAVTIVLALGAALFVWPAAPPRCAAVGGWISERLTGPGAAAGVVTGDLRGAGHMAIDSVWPAPGGAHRFRARHAIATGPSDSILASERGEMIPVTPTLYRIRSVAAVDRGSGGHRGASGTLRTEGELNLATGLLALRYHGELCTGPLRTVLRW